MSCEITENGCPNMRDLNRYVTKRFARNWKDIGIELGIKAHILDNVEINHPLNCEDCFKDTLEKWLKSDTNAMWRTLEVALTNVRRQELGLDPVKGVHGETILLNFSMVVTHTLANTSAQYLEVTYSMLQIQIRAETKLEINI